MRFSLTKCGSLIQNVFNLRLVFVQSATPRKACLSTFLYFGYKMCYRGKPFKKFEYSGPFHLYE